GRASRGEAPARPPAVGRPVNRLIRGEPTRGGLEPGGRAAPTSGGARRLAAGAPPPRSSLRRTGPGAPRTPQASARRRSPVGSAPPNALGLPPAPAGSRLACPGRGRATPRQPATTRLGFGRRRRRPPCPATRRRAGRP